MSVAVRAGQGGDAGLRVGRPEGGHGRDGPGRIEAGEGGDAGVDALPAGRGGAQHDARHAEPGRFLLQPARVGDDDLRAGDGVEHGPVGERGGELDAGQAGEPVEQAGVDEPVVGAGVHREADGAGGAGQVADRLDEAGQALRVVDVRGPVGGDDDAVARAGRDAVGPVAAQRVGDRVADGVDPCRRDTLVGEELGGEGRRREVQRRHRRDGAPVHLLEGALVERAQAGLEVHDRHLVAAGGQPEQRHGARVAEQHDGVGSARGDGLVGVLEERADPGRLAVGERPALVGGELEVLEELVGETRVVVLAGGDRVDVVAGAAQRDDDGRQLHDLGAGAERHEEAHGQDSKISVR